MNLTNDLRLLYAAWPAVDATLIQKTGPNKTGRVILDEPDTALLGGEVIATDFGVRYPASTFPGVRQGDRFVIDSVTYIARENAMSTLDGLECTVPLKRATP